MKPSFFAQHRPELAGLQVSAGNAFAAHQDFAFGTEFDFATRQRLADGSAAQPEGMIHADKRGSLREPVALDHGVPQPPPEFFCGMVEGGAARDERPEFPSQAAMDSAKAPPAPPNLLRRGSIELAMKFRQASGGFLLALDFFFQRLQQPRHGDQDRNSLGVNGLNNFAGI